MAASSRCRSSGFRVSSGRFSRAWTRASRWPRTSRKQARVSSSFPIKVKGSRVPQCARRTESGNQGQVSPAAESQRVKIVLKGWPANSFQDLLRASLASMPSSASTFRARGWTTPAGWLPALHTRTRSLPWWERRASAMMLRHMFPVQTNRTEKGEFVFKTEDPVSSPRQAFDSGTQPGSVR